MSPVADSFVRQPAYRDVNFGASPFLWVKTAAPNAGADRVAYLKFNLNQLNNDGVDRAVLYLSGALQTTGPNFAAITAGVWGVPDTTWQEGDGNVIVRRRGGGGPGSQLSGTDIGDGSDTSGGITWTNQPVQDWPNPAPASAVHLADAIVNRDTFQTYAFDVTGYVQQRKAAGDQFITLAIHANEATEHFMRFVSDEYGGSNGPGHPLLVVSRAGDPGDGFVNARIQASDVGGPGGPFHTISVAYNSTAPIDFSRIDPDDIVVRHEDGGPALEVINPTAEPPLNVASVTGSYSIVGPGGSWDSSDNGLYTVLLREDAVRDGNGNENPAMLGSFRVAVADTQRPTAAISPGPGVTGASGGGTYSFDVTYSDNVAINTATVNVTNVRVFRPNVPGDLTVLSADPTPDNDAGTVRVTYTVQAPGGSWDTTDNGTYTIRQLNNQVRDTAGLDTDIELSQQITVDVGEVDGQAPVVESVSAPAVSSPGGTSHVVTVVYSDNKAVDVSSIGVSDIAVSGPGGVQLQVTEADASPAGNGTPRTATYVVTPPGGSWEATDAGDYTITVRGGEVRDTSGNTNAERTGTFNVNPTQADGQPPAAALESAPNVTAAGGTEHTFSVRYTDNVAVVVNSTLGAEALTVSGPGGPLALLGAVADTNASSRQSVVVTYRVQARGGTWGPEDSGTYTVSLNGGVVQDINGNFSGPATLGTFAVDLGPVDATPPAVQVSPVPTVTSAGGTIEVTVRYTDAGGINQDSLGSNDIVVTGAGGQPLAVDGLSVTSDPSGTDVTATYFVHGPGGQWDEADEGATYSVAVVANAVVDLAGHGSPATNGPSFGVDIGGTNKQGPVATLSAGTVTTFSAANHTITVTYTDGGRVKAASIDKTDIVVTRTGGGAPVTLVVESATAVPPTDDSTVTATYSLAAPGSGWDLADNGTYTVTLNPNAVVDNKGNAATQGPGAWAFNVAVQINDLNAPSAAVIEANGITAEQGERQRVVVQYTDDVAIRSSTINIGADNVVLVGPRGITLPAVSATVVPPGEDGPSLTVTYEFDAPGGTWDAAENGTWNVVFNTGIGGVTDVAGKSIATGGGSFTVNVPAPNPLDVAFGSPNTGFTVEAITTQLDDGKIIAVGRRGGPATGGYQGVIQRRNTDGSLDTAFGSGGQVVVEPMNGADTVFYAVQYANGGILVAGSMDNNLVLARYTLDGRLDTGFGAGGRMFVDYFGAIGEAAYALAVAPDGRIVIAGTTPAQGATAGDVNFAFARFTAGGAVDTTFGGTGKVLYNFNGADVIGALVVQPDGKVVGAGSSGADVVLVRLNVGGDQDLMFGTGGGVLAVPGLRARADTAPFLDRSQALALQGENILIGNHTADDNFAVVRIRPDGRVDQTFGTGGTVTVDLGGVDDVDAVVVEPGTNNVMVVGTTSNGPGGSAATAVVAMDFNGQLIQGWNSGGSVVFEPDVAPVSTELHIGQLVLKAFGTRDANGKLVVGTSDASPTTTSSSLRRLAAPGVQISDKGVLIDSFGFIAGRRKKLTYRFEDGRVVTFTLKGGRTSNAEAYLAGDQINLFINDGGGVSVGVKVKGGSGRVTLGRVAVNGNLRSFSAKTGDLVGTMYVTGQAGKVRLGQVNGGSVVAGGALLSLVADSLADAKVLSGAVLGGNGELGGVGTEADTFTAGVIGNVKVAGRIERSIVAAGLNPVDGVVGNEDDVLIVATPPAQSTIKSVTARGGADDSTRFVAQSVGRVSAPRRLAVGDPRIKTS